MGGIAGTTATGPGRRVRPAAVAGLFYPADGGQLGVLVDRLLAAATSPQLPGGPLRALIVPHAGLVYSGPVAATAYRALAALHPAPRRVVMIGPCHRVWVPGMALPDALALATPLGEVPVDAEGAVQAMRSAAVTVSAAAHAGEHCLEVQLPFLQRVVPDVAVLPLLVGGANPQQVAAVLEPFWQDPATLLLVSTDLSHFAPQAVAEAHDANTVMRICRGATDLAGEDACGAAAVNGLNRLLADQPVQRSVLHRCTSADTTGDPTRVVGYASIAVQAA